MNILYLGETHVFSTSRHRADALSRIGHKVFLLNPYISLPFANNKKFIDYFNFKTGFLFMQGHVERFLRRSLNCLKPHFDIIWVDGGDLIHRNALTFLKGLGQVLLNYNIDDPTGARDRSRFRWHLKSLDLYDLVVTVREPTYRDLQEIGCRNVMKVWRSFDEIAHQPPESSFREKKSYKYDVSFVGTWIRPERRHILFEKVLNSGIHLEVCGPRWNKCASRVVRSSSVEGFLGNESYVDRVLNSKINIGLVSHLNRDQHTTRSLEIPFAGGLLCAERTDEHLQLYRENEDAVFWSTPEELISKCTRLLRDELLRERIRLSGMMRVRQLGVGNETICQSILERAMQCQIER